MVIQIHGNITYKITLDPSTWIFDDRKIHIEDLHHSHENEDTITFDDTVEWNRAIIEGTSKPPTLNTEKKYKTKKEALTQGSFVMNLAPFLGYTEPQSEDAEITFTNQSGDSVTHPFNDRGALYAYFAHNGKRLYPDGMFDLMHHTDTILTHVVAIEIQ